jgi:tripartite-type tricarboxylate transporter receptor subunit TctC
VACAGRCALLAIALCGAAGGPAWAQTYPSKPVTVIVPSAPNSGGTNSALRYVTEKLKDRTGQPFLIDFRPGGITTVGTLAMLRAPADGYTISTANSGFASSAVYVLPYAAADFAPISLYIGIWTAFVASGNLPVKNFAEFIQYAKSRPAQNQVSLATVGPLPQLFSYDLGQRLGFSFLYVPYKGSAEIFQAMGGGHVDATFAAVGAADALAAEGKLKLLALSMPKRSPKYPEVPVVAEYVPGWEFGGWGAFIASAKVPRPIVQRLSNEVREILQSPEVPAMFDKFGVVPTSNTPDELTEMIRKENEYFDRLAKGVGLKPITP